MIPLDRLYHFLADQVNRDMLIYRWSPHGSKKAEDLLPLTNYKQNGEKFGAINPIMICHDQEPLHYDLYNESVMFDVLKWLFRKSTNLDALEPMLREMAHWNLRARVELHNVYDKILLLHSEQNSQELDKFRALDFIPVYYWSHALIARDWFRYARHDPKLQYYNIQQDFLIYNRAWSGTREYRLKFAEGLLNNKLIPQCRTTFSPHCNGTHYTQHKFINSVLAITRFDLDQHFIENTTDSSQSADYCTLDYQQCGIEVILETMMDDTRWHLTEKTLRPIACGMPFILVSTPGTLDYLRHYGFSTFEPYIDESYNLITDPVIRIQAVQAEMRRIATLPTHEKSQLFSKLRSIATRNCTIFFSDGFRQQVINEYRTNLNIALEELANYCNAKHLLQVKNLLDSIPGLRQDRMDHRNFIWQKVTAWLQGQNNPDDHW